MKQKRTELSGETDNSTTIVGDFNTIPQTMRRTGGQKTQDSDGLNNTMNCLALKFIKQDTQRLVFVCGTFSRINQMPGYETSLDKCKRIEIIQNMLAGYIAMKLKSTRYYENPKYLEISK